MIAWQKKRLDIASKNWHLLKMLSVKHHFENGTYLVDQQMLEDLRTERFNTHASNLGAILANEFAEKYHVPAFIVDPVVVDELQPLARISGLKGIQRRSI